MPARPLPRIEGRAAARPGPMVDEEPGARASDGAPTRRRRSVSIRLGRIGGPSTTWLLALLVVGLNAVRFVGLDYSPAGFFTDESSNATHIVCLSETGSDANGQFLPLFADQFEPRIQQAQGTGRVPPTHLYFGALWERIFGHSIASIRAISAFQLALMTLGIYLLLRLFCPAPVALLGGLAASISPWAFQIGRFSGMLAFELPLLVFWLYFLLRSDRLRDGALAGTFLALTLYAYPTAPVTVALLFFPLLWAKCRYGCPSGKFLAVYCLVAASLSLPVLRDLLAPEARIRAAHLSIFSPDNLQKYRSVTPLLFFQIYLNNFRRHFSSEFLFFAGDPNLRHSTRLVGELSWLDIAALVAGTVVGVAVLIGRRITSRTADRKSAGLRPLALLGVVGVIAGVTPAALTFQPIPHALRAAGAVPFIALLTGLGLWSLGRAWRPTPLVAAAIAAAFAGYHLTNYFGAYRVASRGVWEADIVEAAEIGQATGDWRLLLAPRGEYPEVSLRYFLIEYGGESCVSSRTRLAQLRDQIARGT